MNTIETRNASHKVIDHFVCNFMNDCKIDNYTIHTYLSDHNTILSCISDTVVAKKSHVVILERKN